MKETTKRIKSWNELVDFVESLNYNKETIVLSGFINQLFNGHTYINELVFTTKTIEVLREKNDTKPKRVVHKLPAKSKRK